MNSEPSFVPHYCPNCGTIVGEEDICDSCNKGVVFTADELDALDIKYCYACGSLLKTNLVICNNCGIEMKMTQSMIHIQRGRDLFDEGRKEESVVEAKEALALENTPEGRFMICGVIVATQGDLVKEKFLDKYGDIDYFPKEVIESEECQDILKYGKQALEELNKCPPDIRQQIESDPKNNVDGIKHTVKELSEAINNPNPSSASRASDKKSGCFIATAIYGSPYADEIMILQEFRDKYLLNYSLGRAFVRIYYWLSPPIAKHIAEKKSLKGITKAILIVPLVKFAHNTIKKEK